MREILLCNALLREHQGQSLMERASVNLHVLPMIENPADRMAMHNETMRMMASGLDLVQQQSVRHVQARQEPKTGHFERMAQALKVLKATNISEILQDVLNRNSR